MGQAQAKTTSQLSKSGLRVLKSSEILFNEGDKAESLYIIQKGQLRLFKPKGKGFIELAVLRTGEVIGEMAFFDDEGGRRSCSAEAIVETDVVEISFAAFAKTMQGLNPWFKTIINTLAERLRKTNAKVKSLETNSVSGGYGDTLSEYKFFNNAETIKLLSLFFLVFKSHGQEEKGRAKIHLRTLSFYAMDIYNIMESKLLEFVELLKSLNTLRTDLDENGLPKIYIAPNVDVLKKQLYFFTAQRNLPNEKKLTISPKCELFLERILKQLEGEGIEIEAAQAELNSLLKEFKDRNVIIDQEDLLDARQAGLVGDVLVGEGNALHCEVRLKELRSLMPCIRMANAIRKVNDSKDSGSKY